MYKDRRTVNYASTTTCTVYALRPAFQEAALPQRDLEAVVIRALYRGGVVAYKGGHLEKDLLEQDGITVGKLRRVWLSESRIRFMVIHRFVIIVIHRENHAGIINQDQTFKFIHCPKQETFLFFQWLQDQLKEQEDKKL